jgi:hypothetical protein
VLQTSALKQVAGNGPVWQAPYTMMWASCLRTPRIDTGIVEPYQWIIAHRGDRPGDYSGDGAQRTIVPEGSAGTRCCVLRSDSPSPVGASLQFGTARW